MFNFRGAFAPRFYLFSIMLQSLRNGLSSGLQLGGARGFGLRGLISGAINNLFAKKAEKRQFKYNKKLMEFQNALNQANEFSSIGRQIAGMKSAGVNPALADGSAPASVSGSSVSQGSGQAYSGSSEAVVAQQASNLQMDDNVKQSQVSANDAIAREHNANAEGKEIENENARARWSDKDKLLSGQVYQMATSNKYFEQITKDNLRFLGSNADAAKWDAKCKEIDSQTRGRFNQATIDNIVANTRLSEQNAATLVTAAKLNGALIAYYGEETRAKRYLNDMHDYFNSAGWDANPLANQQFEALRKLVIDCDLAAKNGNYTGALTAGQEFANKYAPADKAFQWANMIVNTLMTGLMMYGAYRGLGGTSFAGAGMSVKMPHGTPVPSSRIPSAPTGKGAFTTSGRATYQTVGSSAFRDAAQRARADGWTYNPNVGKWQKPYGRGTASLSDELMMQSYGK